MLERLEALQAAIEDHQRLSNNGPIVAIDEVGNVDFLKVQELMKPVVAAIDTKGEFLPDMSDDEVLDYERKERMGWKDFKLPWNHETTS